MTAFLPSLDSFESFRAWRADPPPWLPPAIDIARSHGVACTAPQVFSTGTNLVVGLDDSLILKIFPPMLRAQYVSERATDRTGAANKRAPEEVCSFFRQKRIFVCNGTAHRTMLAFSRLGLYCSSINSL